MRPQNVALQTSQPVKKQIWNWKDVAIDGLTIGDSISQTSSLYGEPDEKQNFAFRGTEAWRWRKPYHLVEFSKSSRKVIYVDGATLSTRSGESSTIGDPHSKIYDLLDQHCLVSPKVSFFAKDDWPNPFNFFSASDPLETGDYTVEAGLGRVGTLNVAIYGGKIHNFCLVQK